MSLSGGCRRLDHLQPLEALQRFQSGRLGRGLAQGLVGADHVVVNPEPVREPSGAIRVAEGPHDLDALPAWRLSGRFVDRVMPNVVDTEEYRTVRKREIYRAAVESAFQDGEITIRERRMLAALQGQLGLAGEDTVAIEREMAKASR